ncbi:MAG: hypothetical protein IJS58_05775 [Bacilli bacterium]|nr:hypothetical protein [Bacilli bacterium]
MKRNENLFLSDTKVIEFKHFCESVKKRDIYSIPIVDRIFRKYMEDKFFEDIKTYGTKKVVLPKELEEKYLKI